ncbi:MAG: 1,3-beta-galactosyl-N-acetylhexosamine phosphorylase [Lachnospiraceae bacterium]|nr:1,3-beta-galactosyl-N-acetylhexosamine phosphorylase [Lachnospiraceae bacterium]
MSKDLNSGSFTLPGEAGYEKLTLELAEKWGADVIRDSDGTKLSDDLLHAGFGIYSTICLIRDHNEFAKKNMDTLQQTFLVTNPEVATSDSLSISLLEGFFEEQFKINDSKEAMKYWQVMDRTTNREVEKYQWNYDETSGNVIITGIKPYHTYTVSFMAYRIWEEISMYNHTTNNWDKEHLMQIDPRYPKVQEYLLNWMEEWCKTHPDTTVVRFTSMFYNFVWIWGSSMRNRNLFSDWASYDFTVSPKALDEFAKKYKYSLTAEDFVNQGKYHVTHMPSDQKKKDWMEFINQFVIQFGKKLVSIVHRYQKKAYVFYDDSWVGIEPYNGKFEEFGFDGMIKCVFNGYEARLCAGVPVETHEIRLHPYLFPVGLGGAPTFMKGGNPTLDAKNYWKNVRRAVLRAKIDRIGLGGYLHLVQDFPDFVEYISELSDEFRSIKKLHEEGAPLVKKTKVAVLHSYGSIRSWSLSGHFHESNVHDLIHINEALSGFPFEVKFINFEDVKNGALDDTDVVINAGMAGSAWSGGDAWKDEEVVTLLTKWVYEGGTFIGVNEPSAVKGYETYFRMAPVLGIDEDLGDRVNHGKWSYEIEKEDGIRVDGTHIKARENRYLTDGTAKVLADENGIPTVTICENGKGKGIYFASFETNAANNRLLFDLILKEGSKEEDDLYVTDNRFTECSYYPASKKLLVVNNSGADQTAHVKTAVGIKTAQLKPFEMVTIDVD